MSKKLLYATLFIAAFFVLGCEEKGSLDSSAISSGVEKQEEVFRLTGYSGKTYTVKKTATGLDFGESLKGKAVLLNFFATWCPPCKAEIPHLITLQDKYGERFEVLSVCTEEDKTLNEIQEFVQEYGINYDITVGKSNLELGKALGGIKSIPFMILYSTNGDYITHYIGATPIEMIEQDLLSRALVEAK